MIMLRKTGAMKKMNGKMMMNKIAFQDLFEAQTSFQNILINKGFYERFREFGTIKTPVDDVKLASYHIQQLVSEIGEILNADKRWKSHRNDRYDEQEKLEEIADCFIVLMNVAMFSGFNGDVIAEAIKSKLDKNIKRISE